MIHVLLLLQLTSLNTKKTLHSEATKPQPSLKFRHGEPTPFGPAKSICHSVVQPRSVHLEELPGVVRPGGTKMGDSGSWKKIFNQYPMIGSHVIMVYLPYMNA